MSASAPEDDGLERVEIAANRLVDLHGLEFGSDIRKLSESYADLDIRSIPAEVDAISLGLIGHPPLPRPRIILNSSKFPRQGAAQYLVRRYRFTLAHELGHVQLPWHTGINVCHSEGDEELDSPSISSYEQEAHHFARRILVPQRALSRALDECSKSEVLNLLDEAAVHFSVALRSLIELLPPGHVISAVRNGAIERSYRSDHTGPRPPVPGMPIEDAGLDALACERIEGQIGGRKIVWWSFPSVIEFDSVLSDVKIKELWRQLLDSLDLGGRRDSLRSSADGKFSTTMGLVRKGALPFTAEVIATHVLQNVGSEPKLREIYNHPDFRRYVYARARKAEDKGE
ncbi:ImmA/IrrE family metallo-endopeptidase [Rhodococcus pyridinivorans]|uniref:ImmA/IrrE family metallo-endopeptidase n=1 Tax=Rhodococcus pyridinivorans TaxID=103816 RepID=UPI001E28DFCF|nr:ImmA/IrrE family metallo-endopeptidase [Rhodococcus pyridinivorans]MCD5421423.1 ImmA/IrrE family metallo-endopeptidase [Rhodococcus pyridinivorans]